jgi:hypothetical protein
MKCKNNIIAQLHLTGTSGLHHPVPGRFNPTFLFFFSFPITQKTYARLINLQSALSGKSLAEGHIYVLEQRPIGERS